MSITRSSRGREQQVSTFPTAGASSGSVPRQAISRECPTLTDNNCAIFAPSHLPCPLDPRIVEAWRKGGRRAVPGSSGTRGILPEAPLRLVDVAPRPRSPWHYGSHHGMARLMEVLCRVLAGRGVAAADMAARLALPELDPTRSFFQAFLTGARRSRRWKIGRGQVLQVFTRLRYGVLLQMIPSECPFKWIRNQRPARCGSGPCLIPVGRMPR